MFKSRLRENKEFLKGILILKTILLNEEMCNISVRSVLDELITGDCFAYVHAQVVEMLDRKGAKAFSLISEELKNEKGISWENILRNLEFMDKDLIISHLNALEGMVGAEILTQSMDKARLYSSLSTITSTAAFFTVLLNFAVVFVFLGSMDKMGVMI